MTTKQLTETQLDDIAAAGHMDGEEFLALLKDKSFRVVFSSENGNIKDILKAKDTPVQIHFTPAPATPKLPAESMLDKAALKAAIKA